MENLQTRYRRTPNIVSREIAGEQILVPIRKKTADMGEIFILNETGARIWNLLDGQHTLADIRDALAQEYDVAHNVVTEDVLEIVARLQGLGMVQAVADGM